MLLMMAARHRFIFKPERTIIMENTNAMTVQTQTGLEAVFGGIGASFFSGQAKTAEQKKLLANAMNNPDKRLADCVNQEIAIKDIYVEQVDMVKQDTGEVQTCPRIVLIDADGVSYGCVSFGILGSLKKIMSVYGVPTWAEPVTVKPVFINKGNDRRILSLLLV